MIGTQNKDELKYGFATLFLVMMAVFFPAVTEESWFNMIVKIREAITTGDSGHLILPAASNNFLHAVQSTLIFLSISCVLVLTGSQKKINDNIRYAIHFSAFIGMNLLIGYWMKLPWEPLNGMVSALVTLLLIKPSIGDNYPLFRSSVLSIQIFFAFSWLNIMPALNSYQFGVTDVATSIKITSVYLHSTSVMNFMGLAFFLPMFLSAIITSILFMSHDRNISIAKENFQKEKALVAIQSQAMENRIYEEINSLTHDLKTPLVTIRGLNSLLSISKDIGKIGDYTDRIESAVGKMSEMISSFLYDSSRQHLNVDEVVQYVRAQIPVEDERLNIEIHAEPDLPSIYVNKIRVVRALINLIENAIVVPYTNDFKEINIEVTRNGDDIQIIISDNGIGISKEKLDKIWIAGFSTNQTSGLGLSFAKKVIEDNEGTINLKSEVGIGTVVTVSFPGHSS